MAVLYHKIFIAGLSMFLLCGNFIWGQEICNNAKDDDNDGLVDLNDPDCQCRFRVNGNLLQNASFETYDHCPTVYLYDQDHNIADHWQFGTYANVNEAFYFHHFECVADSGNVVSHMPPKMPLPDGRGFISIIKNAYVNPAIPESDMTKTYVAQCLSASLRKGEEYTLSFYAGRFVSWDNPTGELYPFDVAIFGHADCNAVPFGKKNVYGNGCPSNYAGWAMLGKTTVVSNGEWVQTKINLAIPYDINVIEIGPDCSILEPVIMFVDSTTFLDYYQYYLDDFHLLPTAEFPFAYIHPKAGSYCSDHPVLVAPAAANARYQWYKDSIAIPGATDSVYLVTVNEESYYNVSVRTDTNCIISEPFLVTESQLDKIRIPPDTVLCSESSSLLLSDVLEGITYTVNGIAGNVVSITTDGSYDIVATDATGCQKNFSVNITRANCKGCHETMPTAFTPNSDGLNDVFRPRFSCSVSAATLRIYNRWGQQIFVSNDINHGWTGEWNGMQQPPGTYTYVLQFKTNDESKTARGVVVLIR